MNNTIKRANGAKDLVCDAIEETTNLVERMHLLAANKSVRPLTLLEPLATLTQAVKTVHDSTASGVYEMIRMVNRGIRKLLDAGAGLAATALTEQREGMDEQTFGASDRIPAHELVVAQSEAIINGLYGDYLNKKENALDLGMHFRHQGKILPLTKDAVGRAFPGATDRVCIFIHGLMCTEYSWSIAAKKFYGDPTVNFGSQINADFGYTPLFIRYNTGRHISENGRALSELMQRLMECYPVDIMEIVLIGHSMGGLVSRSAAYYGDTGNASWISRLGHIFCVGSPNLGAPLEKAANILGSVLQAFSTPGTQAPAHVLNSRSAGIKDLRFGYTVDDEWMDKNPDVFLKNNRFNLPLVKGVGYYFIGAAITSDPDHPMGFLVGDMLVRIPSASGHTADPARRIHFRSGLIVNGMNHLHLANHPEVYQVIRNFLMAA